MSPGDFERAFIKTGDRETKGGIRVEETAGESLDMLSFGPLETL